MINPETQVRWLLAEMERWVAEGLITPEQRVRLRSRYALPEESRSAQGAPVARQAAASPEAGMSWGLLLFFGLGAAVLGLGVILLFAYNWAEMGRYTKLGVIFGAMIAAHVGGLALREKTDWRAKLGEALSFLGSMMFGAGIWLVAQIYNIDEHFPNGFLIWALGTLALAWGLRSVLQGIAAAVLLTIWSGSEIFEFHATRAWAIPLMLIGVGGLAWRLRSAVLLAVGLAGLALVTLFHAGLWGGPSWVFVAGCALAVLFTGLARLTRDAWGPGGGPTVMAFFGQAGFIICAFILSFQGAARGLMTEYRGYGYVPVSGFFAAFPWVLVVLALLVWGSLLLKKFQGGRAVRLGEWLYPIALIYVQAMSAGWFLPGREIASWVFNLVCLGLALAWMIEGCRSGRLSRVVLGSVVFAALVFARYFDLFHSLAWRGVAFLVLGAVLFAEGFYYRKLRQTKEGRAES